MLAPEVVTHLVNTYGLPLLFLLVMLESAGIPLPGETALVTTSVLASQGHYPIWAVIAVAAAAAIIGDNGGYWVGRKWGRDLLQRWKPIERYANRYIPTAERFFVAHGSKTVFIGRFLPVLRFTAAWLAGITRMEWWKFLIWNAAGGIAWAMVSCSKPSNRITASPAVMVIQDFISPGDTYRGSPG